MVTSARQDDWADHLAIATAVHNSWPNGTTQVPLIQAMLGYITLVSNRTHTVKTNNEVAEDQVAKAEQ